MATTDPGKKPIETYQWLCGDQRCDTMDCFKSTWNTQTVTGLWGAGKLTEFHDAQLAEATRKINDILNGLEKRSGKNRKLSYIKHQNRLMLVWAGYGVVGPDDDFKVVVKALGLRRR